MAFFTVERGLPLDVLRLLSFLSVSRTDVDLSLMKHSRLFLVMSNFSWYGFLLPFLIMGKLFLNG